ncbi:hypothetical protein [Streptococcus pyogenes]|uniref:hypothetical protein n=1 Tax=Streptococcus pyogenes TaxID=1314 RepID=UPI0010A1C441|nr:hypothetical protein [Streptococcus pyogenes]HES9435967.1 hypothetical protein [Streptococcus pyogenes]HES9443089.1 hypothetical protein [Streptococcus pyogenes]
MKQQGHTVMMCLNKTLTIKLSAPLTSNDLVPLSTNEVIIMEPLLPKVVPVLIHLVDKANVSWLTVILQLPILLKTIW